MAEKPPKTETVQPPKPPPHGGVVRKTTIWEGGIPLKEAVNVARTFLHDMEKAGLVQGPITDVQLEGVNQGTREGGDLVIILGYRIKSPFDTPMFGGLAALRAQRSDFYKTFVIDRMTGEVTSMAPYEPTGR